MNKKFTLIITMFLVITMCLTAARKDRQELYLKAVSEKDPAVKVELLKEYIQKYGAKADKFLRFIYLNLSDASYRLKNYDETIQSGEKALEFAELDDANRLRVNFSLANSYYITKKDADKAFEYAQQTIVLAEKLVESTKASEQEAQKVEEFVSNYNTYYVAPAYRLQAMVLYFKGKDDAENIRLATEKALAAYNADKSENSFNRAFSLALNLFKKGKVSDAVNAVETIIDKEKPRFKEANFLAVAYYKLKNKAKSVHYFEMAYRAKPTADLAMKIAKLVHKSDLDKGIRYFADAFVLASLDKDGDAYKYLEQLYFNKKSTDKSPEEKEKEFKQIINAARARLGQPEVTTPAETAEPAQTPTASQ